MPTKIQIIKNLKLSQKLLDYLSKTPQVKKRKNVSYIVITQKDPELNKANLDVAKSLKKKGKKVVKAIETKSSSTPWKFASL